MADRPRVVLLGAGFAGIGAAQKLRGASARLSIIDQHDYHTFQPLLYQVATHELGPAEVAYPVRELLQGGCARAGQPHEPRARAHRRGRASRYLMKSISW